ncbi:hypothetical protein Btru_077041 [Bulinus truncatus]|nr:hypothetical protein Btru_077041 [Bulinus truncatus]
MGSGKDFHRYLYGVGGVGGKRTSFYEFEDFEDVFKIWTSFYEFEDFEDFEGCVIWTSFYEFEDVCGRHFYEFEDALHVGNTDLNPYPTALQTFLGDSWERERGRQKKLVQGASKATALLDSIVKRAHVVNDH